jgi:hypothetical protein
LGEQKTLSVTIGELDAEDTAQPKNLWPGFTVTSITDEIRKEAGSPGNMRGVETLMDFCRVLMANGGKGATFAITGEGNETGAIGLSCQCADGEGDENDRWR